MRKEGWKKLYSQDKLKTRGKRRITYLMNMTKQKANHYLGEMTKRQTETYKGQEIVESHYRQRSNWTRHIEGEEDIKRNENDLSCLLNKGYYSKFPTSYPVRKTF